MTESGASYKEARVIKAARSLLVQWKAYQETAGSYEEAYYKLAKYAYPAWKELEAAITEEEKS